ncbi:4-hydroxythreonine-4-phosphate dehydrogenase [Helicobacter pametensis]|uniref:4-hydroxythreonine-4-phosphate dehydrogenase n=1 Tax=Helicobacter pametensis TaxID=95149 RepID=UPI00048361A0|nr:4-hydroxythreonine-4-phosphate dehydrogenase [Helicobacter pametensis]
MKKIAISCGDLNGIGLEILIKAHTLIYPHITPIYCVHFELLKQASELLNLPLPENLTLSHCLPPSISPPPIKAGTITQESGQYSFESFILGCQLCEDKQAHALCTLPIHKKAWNLANIPYLGHTQALSHRYKTEAIMMLGCEEMFVALLSDHIPLAQVPSLMQSERIYDFFMRLYALYPQERYCVLGINPHCGDDGIIGKEDQEIQNAIKYANHTLQAPIFCGPYPSDCGFIPSKRQEFKTWIAMYHDVGLAPLKALYFEESINVSLGLPILRVSVDHGVAFDIAYQGKATILSYLNAIKFLTHPLFSIKT